MENIKKAFVIRCAPSGINRMNEILKSNQVVIGWSLIEDELFNKKLKREDYKEVLKNKYEDYKDNPYSLGQATGYLWRFIHEMNIGDYALVPISKSFYLAEITSEPIYIPNKIRDDTAIRRDVKWLNNSEPILRDYCGSGLVSRLKYQGTCVEATDLISDIERSLKNANEKIPPKFKTQLNDNLKQHVTKYLISKDSYLDDRKFEHLIKQLMLGLGATTSDIISKSKYGKSIADVDVIANFTHLALQIYIQVKKHEGETDKHSVEQIIEAIKIDNPEGESKIFGWVISSGKFNEKAVKMADENNIRVINGEDLAEMILSVGLEIFE